MAPWTGQGAGRCHSGAEAWRHGGGRRGTPPLPSDGETASAQFPCGHAGRRLHGMGKPERQMPTSAAVVRPRWWAVLEHWNLVHRDPKVMGSRAQRILANDLKRRRFVHDLTAALPTITVPETAGSVSMMRRLTTKCGTWRLTRLCA